MPAPPGRTSASQETHHIGRIVVHPTNPDIVYVAALGDLWGPNKERGVYKSTDGGATWTQTLAINENTGVSDIAIDPQSPNILYAAAYERRRTVFGYNGGGPDAGLYRSIDGGSHWTKMAGGLPATGDVGRCSIDIYRKNTNIVYAEFEHATLGGVYRSEDKGATWTRMSDTNPRPSYFSQIRVDPNNDQKVWLGGVNMYMSEDGGRTFVQTRFRDVHSDVHAIWIDPANSDHIVNGNDGGVWVTWDSGRNWRHLNNIAIGQFYEIAYDFQKPYRVCGGLQDNYSWCGPSASLQTTGIGNEDWITVQGGDGFYARIDPTDANIVYAESQDGNLSRRDLKTSESKSIRPLEDSDTAPRYRFQWNSPLIISPHDPKTIYYGGNHLFKSTDRGDTWVRLGEDLTTNAVRDEQPILGKVPKRGETLSLHDGVVAWPCITAIAESPVRAGVLYAGTDDGNVQVTRDGGKTWSNVASHMPGVPKGAYVSRIEASYKEEGTVYVTFDNHRSGDFAIYIYASKNHGDSWTKITNGIPPEAGTVHVIREDPANPNLLFAGTEFGLFVTFNRGQNWERMKNGLPTVPVFDLQIHPREHDLILATHGRSIWIMDNITALEEIAGNDSVLTTDLHLFTPKPGIEWKTANYRGFLGTGLFFAANPQAGLVLDYFAKTAGPVRVTVKDKAGNDVRQLTGRAEAGAVNRIAWDMRSDAPITARRRTDRRGSGRRPRWTRRRWWRSWSRCRRSAAPARRCQHPAFAAPETGGGGPGEPASRKPRNRRRCGGGGGGGGRGGFGGNRGTLVDPGEYTVALTVAGKDRNQNRHRGGRPAPQHFPRRSHQTPHGHHEALHHDAPGRRRPPQDRRDEHRRDRADRQLEASRRAAGPRRRKESGRRIAGQDQGRTRHLRSPRRRRPWSRRRRRRSPALHASAGEPEDHPPHGRDRRLLRPAHLAPVGRHRRVCRPTPERPGRGSQTGRRSPQAEQADAGRRRPVCHRGPQQRPRRARRPRWRFLAFERDGRHGGGVAVAPA